ncbi:MAG: cyclic 2,3-diphosphoglycerate synthase [candidate division WOR-3 bacterium]|nr:cyclic 2,3-diphosphoglycerate synthase [candidate division WOR-3 bacterium]
MGAAGRDFHNFNTFFRNNEQFEVLGFTAAQIPDIAERKYPKELAGKNYPEGIPVYPEEKLPDLIKEKDVDLVVFAYSDVPHEYVMDKASISCASGADFMLLGPKSTQIKSKKPLISICAVRTGSGKSQTTRFVGKILKEMGKKIAIIRHPMPYGDLANQRVQRFDTLFDMEEANCTIEEMEEYEPHINMGNTVFAGVDYEAILKEAEKDADVVIWDGGNNDFPFYVSDLQIVVADPFRAGNELTYYPGEINFLMADIIIINKVGTAEKEDVEKIKKNIKKYNPDAAIVEAKSPITVEEPAIIKGKRVLVVEDGPTLTHGGMSFGAGWVAAKKYKAKEIVDPRPYAVGSIKDTYKKYQSTGTILPAMGYGETQIKELEATINKANVDAVVIGTPIDLGKLIHIDKPTTRVRYELVVGDNPTVQEAIKGLF